KGGGYMPRKPIPVEPYIDKIEQAIALGATFQLAAKFAGVSIKTFERWRHQAEHARAGTPLAHLRDRLSQAEGRGGVSCLAQIERGAGEGDWRAGAWRLERRWPEHFGRRVHADLSIRIQRAAQEVADELGVDVSLLLREAQAFLAEEHDGA